MSDVLTSALSECGAILVCFDSTDSTNMRAREYAKNTDAKCPAFFIADSQTAGRGRLGRSFYSPECAGLYMTLLIKVSHDTELFSRITAIAAVCASDAVYESFGTRAKIKWVNDLYIGERKVAGILAESFVERGERYVALGIGINIFKSELPEDIASKAVSLFANDGGNDWREERDKIAFCLAKKLLDATKKLDFTEYIEKYREYSCVIGKHIVFWRGGEEISATALDVSDSGALLVLCDDGERAELSSGEITLFVKREET